MTRIAPSRSDPAAPSRCRPFRAVSLDAGGVLLLPDPARVRAALAPLLAGATGSLGGRRRDGGLTAVLTDDRLLAAHYAGMVAFDRPTEATLTRTARYRAAYASALGFGGAALRAAVAALGDVFAEPGLWSSPAPGARTVVRLLAARRLPVVVVSNTDHGDAATLLSRAGLWPDPRPVAAAPGSERAPGLHAGPPVVDSTLVGVAKPDPAIFRRALAVLGLPAQSVVHVGDSAAADVAGAIAAGLAALHLDPLDRCPDRSHGHLAALAELLDLLDPAAATMPRAGTRRGLEPAPSATGTEGETRARPSRPPRPAEADEGQRRSFSAPNDR